MDLMDESSVNSVHLEGVWRSGKGIIKKEMNKIERGGNESRRGWS